MYVRVKDIKTKLLLKYMFNVVQMKQKQPLVIRNHAVYMYIVYIWKWSFAHALGGVSGVASFITTAE